MNEGLWFEPCYVTLQYTYVSKRMLMSDVVRWMICFERKQKRATNR